MIILSKEERKQFEKEAIKLAMSIDCKPIPFDESDYTWEVMVSGGGSSQDPF